MSEGDIFSLRPLLVARSVVPSYTGDVREHARTSVFAWEAADRGQEVHPVADPSQAEMLRKKFDDKKTTLKEVNLEELSCKAALLPLADCFALFCFAFLLFLQVYAGKKRSRVFFFLVLLLSLLLLS